MKISMKEDMGVADEMALMFLESRVRSACNCTLNAPEGSHSQFIVARSKGLQ